MDAAPPASGLHAASAPDAHGLVTVYVTHKRTLFPFRTHKDLRDEAEHIFRHAEYRLWPLKDWPCETVLDAGANFGAFSLFMKMHYKPKRVIAFEPMPDTFAVLRENLRDCPEIEPVNAALSDREGEGALALGDNPALHSLAGTPGGGGGGGSSASVNVAVRRPSRELETRGIDRLSVLKIDTEGSEVAILSDLAPWLPRTDFVLFEYHSEPDRRALDERLSEHFVLYGGHANRPGLGTFKYVARRVLEAYETIPNPPRD